ncbi:MAG: hypothetical protein M3458_11870 [Acidobacteriota bacterium]|nr:hypothetical protein [Acidobacteriota bacterium]
MTFITTVCTNQKEAADLLGIATRAFERDVSLRRIGVRLKKGRIGDQVVFDDDKLRGFGATPRGVRYGAAWGGRRHRW